MKLGHLDTDVSLLGRRDAHHVAAILVVSKEEVKRGEDVAFLGGSNCEVMPCNYYVRTGIADPFVEIYAIPPGTLFWVILDQKLVKNIRHAFDIDEHGYHEKKPDGSAIRQNPETDEGSSDWCQKDCYD